MTQMQISRRRPRSPSAAFTLIELLTAMTVLLIMVLVMVGMTNQTNKIWRSSRARITAFQQARNAFERVTSTLSQATLTTYLDYYEAPPSVNSRSDVLRRALRDFNNDPQAYSLAAAAFKPATYDRASDLQFVCGQSEVGVSPLIKPRGVVSGTRPGHALFFEAPIGYVADPNAGAASNGFKNLNRVLNAVGYYVEFANGNDPKLKKVPAFIKNPVDNWRFRLMEFNQPSQYLSIYSSKVSYVNPGSWFALAVDPAVTPPLAPTFAVADNILALIVRPKVANPTPNAPLATEIAPNYAYDSKLYFTPVTSDIAKLSKNQLPPLVQVTLVAIDSDSADRLALQYGSSPPPLVEVSNQTGLFDDVLNYDRDLATLQTTLQNRRITYRTFVTDVSLPGAKWSETP